MAWAGNQEASQCCGSSSAASVPSHICFLGPQFKKTGRKNPWATSSSWIHTLGTLEITYFVAEKNNSVLRQEQLMIGCRVSTEARLPVSNIQLWVRGSEAEPLSIDTSLSCRTVRLIKLLVLGKWVPVGIAVIQDNQGPMQNGGLLVCLQRNLPPPTQALLCCLLPRFPTSLGTHPRVFLEVPYVLQTCTSSLKKCSLIAAPLGFGRKANIKMNQTTA